MLENVSKFLKKVETKKYEKIANKVAIQMSKDNYSKEASIAELLSIKSSKNNNIDYVKALTHISNLSTIYLGLKPYKSQIKAALVLDAGEIAELATGEGKTLSVIIATILNYIKDGKTHVITANEYLVERDYELSKELFSALNMTSVLLGSESSFAEKKDTYTSDVVYATSKGLVFDYLYNNRVRSADMEFEENYDMVIIDEIDFVLIDEARTPIAVSGSIETDIEKYKTFAEIQKSFKGYKRKGEEKNFPDDVDFIENKNTIEITEKGFEKLELELRSRGIMLEDENIFDGNGFSYISDLEKALKAAHVLKENIDYIISDEYGIVLINPQTGRPQPGRRFSEGVHQSLEALKGFEIQADAKNLGQTTLQNFLKKYKKLSGTTGTAATEELEFKDFYGLKVLPIEPNKPSKRVDLSDVLFFGDKERNQAVLDKIRSNKENGQPTLIGTQTLEDSEKIAELLSSEGIDFNLLNAKNHEKEAYIIANAGKTGAITISTNMAGRGTDIMLGGNKDYETNRLMEDGYSKEEALAQWEKQNQEVANAGGLSIIGISRDFSRRLDNQLIGRSGRQGDKGETQFYLSLDDMLFQNMNLDYLKSNWSKGDRQQGLNFGFLSKIVREAQKNIEGMSFNQRKSLFKFDSVNSEQREIFYEWRKSLLKIEDYSKLISRYYESVIKNIVMSNLETEEFFANDFSNMELDFEKILGQKIDIRELAKSKELEDAEDVIEFISKSMFEMYNEKMQIMDADERLLFESSSLLHAMDLNYAENISNLEVMRVSTSLRSYAQKNPIDEYQKEALEMFSNLVKDVKNDFISGITQFSPEKYLANKEKLKELERNRLLEENTTQTERVISSDEKDSTVKHFKFITSIGV